MSETAPAHTPATGPIATCWPVRPRPVERAEALRDLIAAGGCSIRGLARLLGTSAATVSRALALLKLPEDLRARVERGEVPASTALAIARHPDPAVRAGLGARAGRLRRADVLAASGPRRPARPVVLRGRGLPATVLGRPKPPPGDPAYDAVEVLARAWPGRVSRAQLEAPRPRGAGSGARRNLRALKRSDPDWDLVLELAGKAHKGYAIVAPTPDAPTLSHPFSPPPP